MTPPYSVQTRVGTPLYSILLNSNLEWSSLHSILLYPQKSSVHNTVLLKSNFTLLYIVNEALHCSSYQKCFLLQIVIRRLTSWSYTTTKQSYFLLFMHCSIFVFILVYLNKWRRIKIGLNEFCIYCIEIAIPDDVTNVPLKRT